MLIEEILPSTHLSERHRMAAAGEPERVIAAAAEVTWREVPLTRKLMRIGKDKLDTLVFDEMAAQLGFRELVRTEDELVLGTVLKLPAMSPVPYVSAEDSVLDAFKAFDKPGHLRLVFNFCHTGGALHTLTRGQATSGAGAALTRISWIFIRLGSGMTRKEWLRAAVQRHQRPAAERGPGSGAV
ncbi:hypothetical protein [Streptomyces palmae]|uniref:Uncharacterized protein n=1 Tax=Streptomyces palmae TaxID=1701085 RepID=A0A4Z0HDZ4_9ACTN|nr:hypothetical protein [Streptomyces palmae]TGB19326.1 hypothetical protein E4099_00380 [Streptomyces palmae]